jgi:hypothetical protein
MEHEQLTEDQGQIAADLWLARMEGLAAAVKPEFLPAVVALCDRGWVERRWHGDDAVFWFTDTGLAALEMNALTQSTNDRQN